MTTDLRKDDFHDKELTCVDCKATFIFSAGEQRFWWSKGLIETKRCPPCRQHRRATLPPGNGVRHG